MSSPQTQLRPLRSKSRHLRPRQRGVALIETLVSILIFSFGVLGLIGLQATAVDFSTAAEDRNRASLLANEIASNMWLTGSVALSAAQITAFRAQAANPIQSGLVNGNVAINLVAVNSADIVVTWRAPSDPATAPNRQLTTRVILPQ